MCLALTLKNKKANVFGRNMDIDTSFGQQVVITPRNYIWNYRFQKSNKQNYAMIGMAFPFKDIENNSTLYPLYAEAVNEKGLACAGLNYPETAHYFEPGEIKNGFEITPYEVVGWILSNFTNIKDLKKFIKKNNIVIVNKPISKNLPVAPLHFIVVDKNESIVIEPNKDGIQMYDNPIGVLSNNPSFDWHLYNLSMYQNLVNLQKDEVSWSNYSLKTFGQGFGTVGLPGDLTPPSRFVRAAFYKSVSNVGDTLDSLITEFFHILDASAMPRGSVKVETNHGTNDDITLYSCCMDLDECVYYYKTYNNNQINVIDIKQEKDKLNGKDLIIYPFNDKQSYNYVNKK